MQLDTSFVPSGAGIPFHFSTASTELFASKGWPPITWYMSACHLARQPPAASPCLQCASTVPGQDIAVRHDSESYACWSLPPAKGHKDFQLGWAGHAKQEHGNKPLTHSRSLLQGVSWKILRT